MRTEELILSKPHGTNEEWITFAEVNEYMKEYTKIKCKELLEIVVEKAKIKTVTIPNGLNIKTCVIDEDSILNVVDLEQFIV